MPISSEPIERAEDRADAAVQPRAADDDRGDDGEQVGLAERIAGAVQAAGIEQPGERRADEPESTITAKRTRSTLMPTARAPARAVADGVDMGAEAASRGRRNGRRATASAVQISSDGTPNSLPAPNMLLKVSLVIGTDCRSVSQRATPARRPIVASVTRKDGSRI